MQGNSRSAHKSTSPRLFRPRLSPLQTSTVTPIRLPVVRIPSLVRLRLISIDPASPSPPLTSHHPLPRHNGWVRAMSYSPALWCRSPSWPLSDGTRAAALAPLRVEKSPSAMSSSAPPAPEVAITLDVRRPQGEIDVSLNQRRQLALDVLHQRHGDTDSPVLRSVRLRLVSPVETALLQQLLFCERIVPFVALPRRDSPQ